MSTHNNTTTALLPFASLSEWLVAPVRMALLSLALELELPEIMTRAHALPLIADRLEQNSGEAADMARLASLMDGMAAAGLAVKQNNAYTNSPFAVEYLCKSSPSYLGDMVASLSAMQHRNLTCLRERLFGDDSHAAAKETETSLHNEAHWRQSLAGLAAYQKAGAADTLARLITALPDADNFTAMLDLGCGPGITALRTACLLPKLHVTLCDFPPVLKMARAETERAGMTGRISLRPGDFNTCDFGTGYNLVWACQSLYYANNLSVLLARVYRALLPGGLFVSVHEGVREGVAPADLILSRLSLAMEGQNVSLAHGEMAAAAALAGLEPVHVHTVSMLFGEADMEVFRKPCIVDAGDHE